ncbi:hypothetical protein, partial [Bacillus subtilis]|uniref:hypothetical protein n=1 Tax=Bacillus subtilis TaxID=1423 RepID=UPI003C13A320
HADRKIVCMTRENFQCADYADSGTWLTMCQTVSPTSFNNPPPNRPELYTSWNLGEDATASIKLVSRSHGGPISIPLEYSEFTNRV